MTGPEHYREAERLIGQAHIMQSNNGPGCGSEEELAEAQVHATLALAAASAIQSLNSPHQFRAWREVIDGEAEAGSTRVFPIYARFAHPDNGYDADIKEAAKYLTPGKDYLIDHMDVGRSHTTIYLHDFPGIGFNSVMFASGNEPDESAS